MSVNGRRPNNESGAAGGRRSCAVVSMGLCVLALVPPGSHSAEAQDRDPLPPPIVTGQSTEICLNSRVSRHSGLSGTATDQQIANVLWAAGRAPITGSYRTIYLRDHIGTYIYHPEDHSLEYSSGTTVANAFRINYDRERDFDAGVSYELALAASVSLWTGTTNQVASCPQMSDLNFGIAGVPGLTSQLVAVSSNGSLPDPVTDGTNQLEEVLATVRLRPRLRRDLDLTPQRLSQILWAGYGCTAHMTSSGRAALTVPSWMAGYFLTNRIYVVDERVSRYANRVGSDLATRDHRLDLVQDADVRDALRQALPDLPIAPCYVVLCLSQTGMTTWYYKLESGMAAGGMLLQAEALGLGCAFKADLTPAEQSAVRQVTPIPASDYPHAIVALGHRPADVDGDGDVDLDDLGCFVNVLLGLDTDPGHLAAADFTGDDAADGLDIQMFVGAMIEN